MVTLAEKLNSQWWIWRKEARILANLVLQVWKSGTWIWKLDWRIMTQNPPIVITVKLMVKMKNLFRLKDGPLASDHNNSLSTDN